MRHEHAHTGTVVLAKQAPQALVEAADAVVRVGGRLAVGDAVEEVPVLRALAPHALHLGRRRLEVAKVLLAQARLLVHLDRMAARERRRMRRRLAVAGRQRLEDACAWVV